MLQVFTSFHKVWLLFVSSLLLISATEVSGERLKRDIGFYSTRPPVTFPATAQSGQGTVPMLNSSMTEVEMEKMRNNTKNGIELDEFGFPIIPGARNRGSEYSTARSGVQLPTEEEQSTRIIDYDLDMSSMVEKGTKVIDQDHLSSEDTTQSGEVDTILIYCAASVGVFALLVLTMSLILVHKRRAKKVILTQI